MWKEVLRNKNIGSKAISQVYWKSEESHFWAGLMKVKQSFFRFGTFYIRNVSHMSF